VPMWRNTFNGMQRDGILHNSFVTFIIFPLRN
jgi:hypothetical protein